MNRLHDFANRAAATAGCALLIGLALCANPTRAATTDMCLRTHEIDHTSIPDNSTILFHMKDGKVWKNSLHAPCFNLKFQGSFQYTADFEEICANAQTIRVLQPGVGARFGASCLLGEFTPVANPRKLD